MKKRKAYRPRPVLLNPMGYVLDGMSSVKRHSSHILDLQLKNNAALANLTKGVATRRDMDYLVAMVNMVEALYRLGFGLEYEDEVRAGLDALHAVGSRGAGSGKFILRASEMEAINTVMELHDAQMDVITINDLEKALKIVKDELVKKRARVIKENQE